MMTKLRNLIGVGLAIIGVLSLLGFLGRLHRLLELTTHFRLQYLLGATLGLIAMLLWRNWRWSLVASMIVALNAFYVLPWLFPGSAHAAAATTGHRLKLFQSNVKYSNNQYAAMIAYLKEEAPDIVTLQEIDRNWAENLGPLREAFPYAHIEAEATGSGIALYSKIKLEQVARVELGLSWRPSIQAEFKLGDTLVHLLTIHPPTPTEAPNYIARNEQFSATTQRLRSLPNPKILIGDLNDTVWSSHHAHMLAQTNMVNARKGHGLLPSWPAWLIFKPLMIPIDQCLVSPEIEVVAMRTGKNIGSDHLPLIVEVMIPAKKVN
jgi:endonuclease/exonuclease/phosphatase (EEP) superfamily protein YafD